MRRRVPGAMTWLPDRNTEGLVGFSRSLSRGAALGAGQGEAGRYGVQRGDGVVREKQASVIDLSMEIVGRL